MTRSRPIRTFVVGCPRSGTTLLQSILAAHPELTSFPETHFFNYYADSTISEGLSGLLRSELRAEMGVFFRDRGYDDWAEQFERWRPLRRRYGELFTEALDAIALDRDAAGWVEKTPSHLERIETIEEFVPGVKFVHIVRNGADVVASLHQVTHEYPDQWGGERSIDRCIERWNRSMKRTDHYLDSANHELVGYRQLTARPEPHVRRLCTFLGVDFEPQMLEDYREEAERVSEDHEEWKERTSEPIQDRGSKFEERFDEDQRRYVLERLDAAGRDWPTANRD